MVKYLTDRLKSFGYAGAGLKKMLQTQPNAKLHLFATITVVIAGIYFALTPSEWLWIALAVTLVWALELVNSAIEHVCDLLSPEHSDSVKHAKDLAAGAVLVGAIFALVVAAVLFGPKIRDLF